MTDRDIHAAIARAFEAGLATVSGALMPSRPSRAKFDRNRYQREYMRDLPQAKALGLTVKQWRARHGK